MIDLAQDLNLVPQVRRSAFLLVNHLQRAHEAVRPPLRLPHHGEGALAERAPDVVPVLHVLREELVPPILPAAARGDLIRPRPGTALRHPRTDSPHELPASPQPLPSRAPPEALALQPKAKSLLVNLFLLEIEWGGPAQRARPPSLGTPTSAALSARQPAQRATSLSATKLTAPRTIVPLSTLYPSAERHPPLAGADRVGARR